MKTTRLGSFSTEFLEALCELRGCLRETASHLARISGEPGCKAVGSGLDEHSRELERLFERLSQERSTVFLFGPGNAGKSTLINALARRSMVEVSPLPGYPAPVFVEYGEKDEVSLQRFDGSSLEGLGASAARIELRRFHGELSEHLRRFQGGTPEAGEPGDGRPATSLRRIHVSVTNQDLERARVRFVECPASATPLFDNHADMLMGSHAGPGIAAYCVRAEHLFDESAFRGIEELLGLFKQIHVVVNLDCESRDLSADGDVVPGLAASDPVRLIEVFESLCTQPRLLQALEQGQVRFFPIDLLNAASSSIRSGGSPVLPFEPEAAAVEDGESPAAATEEALLASDGEPLGASDRSLPRPMRELEQRLSTSLDDSEELSTLVKSTLRRAREILGETLQLLESSELARARTEHGRCVEAREHNLETRAVLERVIARDERDWELEPCFEELRTRLLARARDAADGLREELEPVLLSLLNDWFESEDTLQALIETSLAPRLAEVRDGLQRAVALELHGVWSPDLEAFGDGTRTELERAGLDPADHGELVQGESAELEDARPLRPIDMDAIAVGAGFFDRLFLRSGSRLRRKVFGPPEAPAKPISSKRKARRFDEEARQALRDNVTGRLAAYSSDLCRRLASDVTRHQLRHFAESLRQEARSRVEALAGPREELGLRIEALEALQEQVRELARVRSAAVESLEPLAARHARADLEVLVPHTQPPALHGGAAETVGELV